MEICSKSKERTCHRPIFLKILFRMPNKNIQTVCIYYGTFNNTFGHGKDVFLVCKKNGPLKMKRYTLYTFGSCVISGRPIGYSLEN